MNVCSDHLLRTTGNGLSEPGSSGFVRMLMLMLKLELMLKLDFQVI